MKKGKKRQCPYSGYQEFAQLELEYSVNITTNMLQISMFVHISIYNYIYLDTLMNILIYA